MKRVLVAALVLWIVLSATHLILRFLVPSPHARGGVALLVGAFAFALYRLHANQLPLPAFFMVALLCAVPGLVRLLAMPFLSEVPLAWVVVMAISTVISAAVTAVLALGIAWLLSKTPMHRRLLNTRRH
ncbi:hypothetical protein ACFLSJ_01010 [Verrucomicrobiota bacterium]